MKTELVTDATGTISSTSDVKAHLRVSTTDDDPYMLTLLKVATDRVEEYTNRKLMTQTWYAYFDDWPDGNSIELPYAPLQSVGSTAIVYYDSNGSTTVMDSTKYVSDTVSEPGRVVLRNDCDWPTTSLYNSNPIRVEFTAGYGAASDVPDHYKQAALIWTADMYEQRESFIVGQTVTGMPNSVESILFPKRLWSF